MKANSNQENIPFSYSGQKRTIVVEGGHGLIAHRMLLEWLETLQEADIVTIEIHH
jgi:hypothetical protein